METMGRNRKKKKEKKRKKQGREKKKKRKKGFILSKNFHSFRPTLQLRRF